MSNIVIRDLDESKELDANAMSKINGGLRKEIGPPLREQLRAAFPSYMESDTGLRVTTSPIRAIDYT
jgi:hypothetical protein